jgi:hypothetical protein
VQWRFVESAFKHGFDEIDFYEVLASRPLKLRGRRGLAAVYELFGQNFAGTYLFMVYRRTKHEQVVFHMSEMTDGEKKFYRRHRK